MQVTLCNRNHPEYGVATIPLPIPNEEYDNCMELLEKLEIGDVTAHDCYLDQIADAPISLHFLEGTMINVDELDFLARCLDRYTEYEMAQFQCMVATRENWDVQTLINLSFSCDMVTVITDFSKLDEVGRAHYHADRRNFESASERMNRLLDYLNGRELSPRQEQSGSPSMTLEQTM